MKFKRHIFQWIFVILIVNLCTELCTGAEINSDDEDGKNVFDLFVFTQTWPTSECVNWKAQNEKNACILPSKKDTWTIHGIWPSKKSISIPQQPAFCRTSSTKFDVESMDSETLEQLKKYWPSIHKDDTHEKFWEYEWNKHGKCATPLEEFDSPNKYFEQGLTWIRQYSIYDVLSKANILPGSFYDVIDVNNAIRSGFHVNAMISCTKMKDSDGNLGKQYLREIKLCFNMQLELIDCGKTSSRTVITNCDKRKVYYPDIAPGDTDQDHESTLWRFTYHFVSLIFLILIVLFAYKTAKNLSNS